MRWPTAPIGELVTIRGGGTPRRDNEAFFRGEIPWVTPKDMKRWEIDDALLKITKGAIESSATNLIPANTVLLLVRSGVLKHTAPIAINRRPVAINQDIKSLECNGNIVLEYLARFLKNAEPIILGWVRATTADNYPIDNIRELPIPLPPLAEQRRIAAILDQADDLRRKRRAALERLEGLIDADFIRRFCRQETDWQEVCIAEISTAIRTGPFGSQLLHSEFTSEGIAVLGIDNAVTTSSGRLREGISARRNIVS